MPQTTSTLDRIAALKAEIETLEASALDELKQKRNALAEELESVDAEIARLSGEPSGRRGRGTGRAARPAGKQISFELLKTILRDLPGKTMNIRKEGYDSKQIKTLVLAHPESLVFGGKGPWPTVSLAK